MSKSQKLLQRRLRRISRSRCNITRSQEMLRFTRRTETRVGHHTMSTSGSDRRQGPLRHFSIAEGRRERFLRPGPRHHLGRILDLTGEVTSEKDVVPFGLPPTVFEAYCSELSTQVSVKPLHVSAGGNCFNRENIIREIRVLCQQSHANVLSFIGYTLTSEGDRISLVTPWMVKGNLRGVMRTLKVQDMFLMCDGIARGLRYLHSNQVIHSDLRTDNVLLSPAGTPLLADVGISMLEASFSDREGPIADSVWKSLRWSACEFFEFSDDDVNSTRRLIHNEKTDVWAFGMTLYELLSGDVPFAKIRSDLKVISAIANKSLPREPAHTGSPSSVALRRYMWSMCCQCWATNPAHRPSMGMLLKKIEGYQRGFEIGVNGTTTLTE